MYRVSIKTILTIFLLWVPLSYAGEAKKGHDYTILPKKIRHSVFVQDFMTKDFEKKNVQIIEFFSYTCHWCHEVGPRITQWRDEEPPHLSFYRVHVTYDKLRMNFARSYYSLQVIGFDEAMHCKLFDTVQEESTNLGKLDLFADFLKNNNFKQDVAAIYESKEVDEKIAFATCIDDGFRIIGTPTFIINGPLNSYSVALTKSGGVEQLMDVLKELTEKELQGMEF